MRTFLGFITSLITTNSYKQQSSRYLIRAKLFCCIMRDRGITPAGMLSRLGGGHLDRHTERHATTAQCKEQ